MRIKSPNNTVYRKLAPTEDLSIGDFRRRFKWFFTGESFEKVVRLSVEEKETMYWIDVTTENGDYLVKARKPWGFGNGIKYVIESYGDKPVMAYETPEDFVKDFKASTDDDYRILEQYRKAFERKSKQMETETRIKEVISMEYPEFFL